MTRAGAIALILAFSAAGASAQEAPGRVDSVLAAMFKASGGEAWNGVRTLRTTATVAAGGEQTALEVREDVAAGRYAIHETGGGRVSNSGFDGVTPWRDNGGGIAYSLGDINSARSSADEAFRVSRAWWLRDRHPATIALAGVRTEKGESFDVLDITPAGGSPFEAWVDQKTHLLARTVEQQAEDLVTTDYADYRPVKGLKLPFAIRSGDDVETIGSVEVNPATPDAAYSIPPRPAPDIDFPPGRDSVDIPFRLTADNRILVPLTINGQVVDAMFDSGGSLILQPALMKTLQVAASGQWAQSGGGEGQTVASKGRLSSVGLAGAVIRDVPFHSFLFYPDRPQEALAGLEILQRFVVRIDFDRRVMTLTRPDAFAYRGEGSVIPFHFQDNQPEIKGSVDGIEGLFAIDTGDNSSLLLIAPFARRHGLVARYQADVPYDGKAVSATHGVWARRRAHVVAFDGPDGRPLVQVHDPVTRISLQTRGFDANRDVSANIGLGILKQFNLTFDYSRQRLILEPSRFYGQPDVFNRTGMAVDHSSAGWTVQSVYPNSPASEAGLKPGDTLVEINGAPAEGFDRERLWPLLKGAVGSRLAVGVSSGGARRRVELVLRNVM